MTSVVDELRAIVARTGAKIKGPVPLPTRKEKFTVNRSPHGDKKSREQFEIRTHKRLIILNEITAETVTALNAIAPPAGVEVKVKIEGYTEATAIAAE